MLKILLKLLIFHIFFGFIWSTTRIQVPYANNILSIVYLGMFLVIILKNTNIYVDIPIFAWIPFLIYTIGGYLIQGELVYFCTWMICLIVLLLGISVNSNFIETFPTKFIFGSGIFCMIGIFFQFMFQDVYDQYIATLFLNSDRIIAFGHGEYGFAGFTYQLDTTAMPILYAMGVFLYDNSILKKKKSSKLFKSVIYIVFVMVIVMTGKRTNALLAVIIPALILIISNKQASKRVRNALIVGTLALGAFYFIYINAELLYNTTIFHRVGSTIINLQKGNDITSGRTELYAKAFEVYSTHKFLGVGVGNFINYANAATDVHNVYLQVLCEQDILGEVLFILPVILCLFSGVKLLINEKNDNYRSVYQFSLFVQLIYIAYGMTGNLNINLYGYMVYFLAIAMMGAASYRKNCVHVL